MTDFTFLIGGATAFMASVLLLYLAIKIQRNTLPPSPKVHLISQDNQHHIIGDVFVPRTLYRTSSAVEVELFCIMLTDENNTQGITYHREKKTLPIKPDKFRNGQAIWNVSFATPKTSTGDVHIQMVNVSTRSGEHSKKTYSTTATSSS